MVIAIIETSVLAILALHPLWDNHPTIKMTRYFAVPFIHGEDEQARSQAFAVQIEAWLR